MAAQSESVERRRRPRRLNSRQSSGILSHPRLDSEFFMNTRRQFLIQAPLGLLGVAAACRGENQGSSAPSAASTPGTPPAFVTSPEVGPPASTTTFPEAQQL